MDNDKDELKNITGNIKSNISFSFGLSIMIYITITMINLVLLKYLMS